MDINVGFEYYKQCKIVEALQEKLKKVEDMIYESEVTYDGKNSYWLVDSRKARELLEENK